MVFSLSYITISSLNVYNMMLTELCRMMTSLLYRSKSLCRCHRSGIKEENKPKRDKIAIFRMADFLPNCSAHLDACVVNDLEKYCLENSAFTLMFE